MTNTEMYRLDIGYSARQLSIESGVDRHAIYRIEDGLGKKIYDRTYFRLAKVFARETGKDVKEIYKELLEDKEYIA